jgi:hypothetical protein
MVAEARRAVVPVAAGSDANVTRLRSEASRTLWVQESQ